MMKILVFCSLVLLTACGSLPDRAITTTDQQPSLSILHAPEGALLTIDGGYGQRLEKGKNHFAIEPGNHLVEVSMGGVKLYSREIFVQGDTVREIDLEAR